MPTHATSKNVSVLLEGCAPLSRTLALSLPQDATTADILAGVGLGLQGSSAQSDLAQRFYLTSSTKPGRVLTPCSTPLRRAADDGSQDGLVILRVHARVLGGKGGFGSMLRAAGGKMSAKQGQGNTDSCRDLNGRRLSVMKEAKALATYIENEPARLKALDEAQKQKYAKLERMLGRQPKAAADFEEAARRLADAEERGDEQASGENGDRGEGSSKQTAGIGAKQASQPSGAARGPASSSIPITAAGIKRKERLEDSEYVEQSREIVDNVRSAVAAAMMKKRKKAKTTASTPAPTKAPTAAPTTA